MYTLAKISIFVNILGFIKSTYLESELNYRSKVERNNILNKGLWVKKTPQARHSSAFIFKTNSFDIDNILENNNDFTQREGQSLPFFSGYVARNKRDAEEPVESNGNISKLCENDKCSSKENKREISKILSTIIKPISVLNDSYNIDGLISHTDHYNIIHNIPPHVYTPVDPNTKYYIDNITKDFEKIMKPVWVSAKENTQSSPNDINNKPIFYSINDVNLDPTNMSRNNYESQLTKKIDNEKINTINNNILDKYQLALQQTTPVRKPYFLEKLQEKTNVSKSINKTDKGLLKVLGMLTKTFKRIMKQHNGIKQIHNKLHSLNSDFMNNLEMLTKKFEDFDNKYNQIMEINKKLNENENNNSRKKEQDLNKENELSNNLIEFGKQQRKFIIQQSRFYKVQKQLLEQNEKITYKQEHIAKSQSDISHKQNHLARILSKVHQTSAPTHHTKENVSKQTNVIKTSEIKYQSTTLVPQTESIKINLFSIPPLKELQNNDKDILNDKDEHPIDDLIYKYYFNKTFIDEIIKNKLLANVINVSDSKHDSKKRKPRKKSTTTILLPVNTFDEPKHRERRWLRRSKKKTGKHENTTPISKTTKNILKEPNREKPNTDPFMKMAMTFCTAVNQTQNVQTYNWCVEKTLRRIQFIDYTNVPTYHVKNNSLPRATFSIPSSVTPETSTRTLSTPLKGVAAEANSAKYFPDNDELETNLKEYELKPDTEGNVYFDRSLHISDIEHIGSKDKDSDGFSDILPESNSNIELDPAAIQLQSRRRAEVRRINEKINKIKMA